MTSVGVTVHLIDLDPPEAALTRLDALIPPTERDSRPPVRVARAFTRGVLGEALGVAPTAVPIVRTCEHCGHPTHGRPRLPDDATPRFSVTHSGSVGLVAISDSPVAVGIDVEMIRPRTRLDRLAARIMGADELSEWRAAPEDERLVRFLRTWTSKEAYLKAMGTGINQQLATVHAPPGWSTLSVDLESGAVAALAVDAAEVAIEVQEWSFGELNESDGTAG